MEKSTAKRRWSCPDDTQSAKALRPTLILEPKSGSPLLMLSLEGGDCRVYSPEEDRVYETKSDFSGYRFLGNSGKWFLAVDPQSKLWILDVFSEEKIRLPPLESIKGGHFKIERVGDNKFNHGLITHMSPGICKTAEDVRGLLWVDDKTGDYVVVWQFEDNDYLGFCKKGDNHYREITTRIDVPRELRGQNHMVLKGYSLYIFAVREFIRHLDLSGQDGAGFKDVSVRHRLPMWQPDMSCKDEIERMRGNKIISCNDNIFVTRSEEVLIVHTRAWELTTTFERHRMFRVYKRDSKDLDPNTRDTRLVEVDSLGDEALFLDMGITVPADPTLGIEPNSIYFTRDDRFRRQKLSCLDICVYNLATKTIKRFPTLPNFKPKDAQWFLPC